MIIRSANPDLRFIFHILAAILGVVGVKLVYLPTIRVVRGKLLYRGVVRGKLQYRGVVRGKLQYKGVVRGKLQYRVRRKLQ